MIRETPEIRQRVNELYQQHGILTPDLVIEDAKNATSPLHDQFEWDVNKAAEQHWLETAREIIRCVRVISIVETKEVETVAYVHVPGQQQGYKSISKIKSDREASMEILLVEFQRVADILARAKGVAMALGLAEEVDRLLVEVGAVREVVRVRSKRLSRPETSRQQRSKKQK